MDEKETWELIDRSREGNEQDADVQAGDVFPHLPDEEFEALLEAAAPARYEYFVKRCADQEHVWGLVNDEGWATGHDDETESESFAVWPRERFAAAAATGEWSGRTPEAIQIEEWLEGWLPELAEKGWLCAVFPVPSGVSVHVAPDQVAQDLRTELARY